MLGRVSCRGRQHQAGDVHLIVRGSVERLAGWSGPQRPRVYRGRQGGHGTDEQLWNVEKAAYAKGKVDAEKYGNAWGEETGIDVVSNMPAMVLRGC